MLTWQEASQLPEYGVLTDTEKIKAKIDYFNASVRDIGLPSELIPQARTEFFEFAKEKPKTSISPITEGVADFVLGMAETPIAIASPVVGGIVNFLNPIPGLKGIKKYATEAYKTGDTDKALRESTKTIKETQEAFEPYLVYQAQTPAGKLAQSAIAKAFDFFIHKPAQAGGELGRKLTEPLGTDISSTVGAIIEPSLELGGYAILFKGMNQGLKNKILNKEPLTIKEQQLAEKSIIDISKELKKEAEINREHIPAYERAGIEPKGYVHDLEVVEPSLPKQIEGMPERLALPEPQTKGLPPSPITYGDNFVSMPPEIAPELKYPYAGQKRLPPATDFEVTPEGQGINIQGQEAISRIEPSQILFDNLTKPQALYQQGKRFKQTGIKPEIRQMTDGSYYLYEMKPDFKLPIEKPIEGKSPQGETPKPQGVTSLESRLPEPQAVEGLPEKASPLDKPVIDKKDYILAGKKLPSETESIIDYLKREYPDVTNDEIDIAAHRVADIFGGLGEGARGKVAGAGYSTSEAWRRFANTRQEVGARGGRAALDYGIPEFERHLRDVVNERQVKPQEAWKLSLDELIEQNKREGLPTDTEIVQPYHEQQVLKAYNEGKPIPENNLVEYGIKEAPLGAEYGNLPLEDRAGLLERNVSKEKGFLSEGKSEADKLRQTGTTVRPVKSKMQQIGEKTISIRPKPYQISGQSEGKLKVDKSILKSEQGGASLDLLVPELPTIEDLKYGKALLRPIASEEKDYEKEIDDAIIKGIHWLGNKSRQELDRLTKASRGELSPKEEKKVYSEAMYGMAGFVSPMKMVVTLKDALGITPKSLSKAEDLSRIGSFFALPQTILRKYGARYPMIAKIINANKLRQRQAGYGVHKDAEIFKHFNNIPETDRMAGLDAYIKSAGKEALDESYNKLSPLGRRAFSIIQKPLQSIRDDLINTSKKDLVEYVQAGKQPDNIKALAIEGINKLDTKLIPKGYDNLIDRIEILQSYGKRNFYLPMSRKGNWTVGLDEPANNRVLFDVGFKGGQEAREFKILLQKAVNEGDISIVDNWFKSAGQKTPQGILDMIKSGRVGVYSRKLRKTPYEASQDIPMTKTYSTLKALGEKAGAKQDFIDAVTEDYLNWMKEKGFSHHFIKRKGIAGWSTKPDDAIESVSDYIKGYYMMKAKRDAAKTIFDTWGDIAVKKDVPEELLKSMNGYIDYTFGSPETTSGIAAGVSKYFLWGRAKSMIVNSTQNATSGMAAYIHNGISPLIMVKAMKDVAIRKLSFTDKKAIAKLLQTGQGQSLLFEEIAGHISKGKISDAGMLPFQFAETYVNRIPNFLGAFRHFNKTNNLDTSVSKAIEVMNEGHYWASRFNRNEFSRGNFMRIVTALTTFTQQYIGQVNHYAGEGDMKALAYLLASPTVLGGLAAIPTGEVGLIALKKAYKTTTGRELSLDIEKIPNEFTQNLVKRGILGTMGLGGLSQSVGVGASATPERNIPVYSLYASIEKAIESANRGDYDRAVEQLLPSTGKDIMGSIREYREGVSTSTGTPIVDEKGKQIKLTGKEFAKKLTGIENERILKTRDYTTINREIMNERKSIMTKFRTAYIDADTPEQEDKIKDEILAYNEDLEKRYNNTKNILEKQRLLMLIIEPRDFVRSVRGKEKGMITSLGGKEGMRLYGELQNQADIVPESRADGGEIEKGKPYLVGEEGVEIIIPKEDGIVIPNNEIDPEVNNYDTAEQVGEPEVIPQEEIKAEEPVKPDLSEIEVSAYADINGHWTKIPMKYQEAIDTNLAMMDILKKPFDEIGKMVNAQLRKDIKEDFKAFREQGLTKRKAQKMVVADLRERFEDERKEIEEQIS